MKKKLLLAMGLLGALAFATGEVAAQEKTTAAPATASPAKPEKPAKTTPGAATTKTSKAAKTAKGEKAATGEKAAAAAPAMPKPGPETAALKPFVANLNWTGTVKAGAHGPDSPEMATRGHQRCRFRIILHPLYTDDRPERLLSHHPHPMIYIHQYRRLDKITLPIHPMPPNQ